MNQSLTDALCTRCGLCCDGSLFADVELSGPAETMGLEAMGLEVDEDDDGGGLLVQPCAALQGRRCSVYAQRPKCCRTFECQLLQNVRRGTVTLQQAIDIVATTQTKIGRLRQLAASLGQTDGMSLKESCMEALELSAETCSSPEVERQRRQLEAELMEVERILRTQFLGASKLKKVHAG